MASSIRTSRAAVAALVAAVAVLALAACGGSSAESTPTPSPTPSQGGLAALKAYAGDVKPIVTQVTTTIAALPDAVQGLSRRPDASWSEAASNLDAIATQLGDEAASLGALTPPSVLEPVQAAGVKGIQRAQAAVSDLAGRLDKRAATSATNRAKVLGEIDALKTELSQLSQQLSNAVRALTGSGATTAP